MTKEDRDAITALLSDPMRLFPEERAAIVGLIGRVVRLEKAGGIEDPAEGFPELPRNGGVCTCGARRREPCHPRCGL